MGVGEWMTRLDVCVLGEVEEGGLGVGGWVSEWLDCVCVLGEVEEGGGCFFVFFWGGEWVTSVCVLGKVEEGGLVGGEMGSLVQGG